MFDIILPVRNRFNTFEKTYYSCVKFIKSDPRLNSSKIIIIDNNSDDIPKEFILSLPSIVKYVTFNEMLPMNQNWQRALKFLKNNYFTYVGADDALIFDKLSIDKIFFEEKIWSIIIKIFWLSTQQQCYFHLINLAILLTSASIFVLGSHPRILFAFS